MDWIKKIIWDYAIKKVIEFPFDFLRTFLIIAILETLSLVLYPIMNLWALILLFPIAVLLALACNLTFRGSKPKDPDEKLKQEVSKLQDEVETKKKENEALSGKLEAKDKEVSEQKEHLSQRTMQLEELKKRGMNVLESENVFLLSLLKLKLTEVVPIDKLSEDGDLKIFDRSWNSENKKIKDNAYRRITAIRITKTLFIGFNLEDVSVSASNGTAKYLLPKKPMVTFDLEDQSEDYPIDLIMLKPDRTFYGKLKQSFGVIPGFDRSMRLVFSDYDSESFGIYDCTWKIIDQNDKNQPNAMSVVKDERVISKEAKEAYSNSPVIKNASEEVKRRIKMNIIEKQIRYKGYVPLEVDSFPEDCETTNLVQFMKTSEFMLGSEERQIGK
ncbi:MAG: hypothetical protein WAX69_23585 [Victivallales bacterium]